MLNQDMKIDHILEIVKGIESIKNCKAPGENGSVIGMKKAAKIEIVSHL